MADALEHEQTAVNGTIIEVEQNGQTLPLVGTPLRMADGAFRLRYGPPGLGAHGYEVLSEAGFSDERIDELTNDGVVAGRRRGAAA